MQEPAQTAGGGRGRGDGGRGGGRGARGGRGGGGPAQGALPPTQDCPKCNGHHRPNQRCWDPCRWCHTAHHHRAPCNGPGPQPHLPPPTLQAATFTPETAYYIGQGMAGFRPPPLMAGAGSPPPSHPGVASSQRGSFAAEPEKVKEGTPAGSLPASGGAAAKTGSRQKKHRGGKGKRKRTTAGEDTAVEDAVMKDAGGVVQQQEPPLKKVRGEEEEAAAATGGQPPANRRERRAALTAPSAAELAAQLAGLRQFLSFLPEEVLHQARQAQEGAARQAQEADANARAAHAANEQARQAHAIAQAEADQAAHAAEEERWHEQSGLGMVQQADTADPPEQGATTREEMQDNGALFAEAGFGAGFADFGDAES